MRGWRIAGALAGAAALFGAAAWAASGDISGDFDFYVLSLSWSPTYCATDDRPDPRQCNVSGLGFVVHGLWPQYEHGYPLDCYSRDPRYLTSRALQASRDVMPSPGLAEHEWQKHGRCSGLSQVDYFALMKKARDTVTVPPEFRSPPGRMSPTAIEAAFMRVNPGLAKNAVAVTCTGGRINEVRVCMDKSLGFRPCGEVDAQACRAGTVGIPASR